MMLYLGMASGAIALQGESLAEISMISGQVESQRLPIRAPGNISAKKVHNPTNICDPDQLSEVK